MGQSLLLIQALKQMLKIKNKTYKAIALHLQLSEASIKRMFAKKELSLARIDAICELLEIEISDLLQMMHHLSKRITQLTLDQEKIIVNDHKLCLVTVCVINRWTFDEILNYYDLTEFECIKYLALLDKIKIIELLPKNKIKLLISSHFTWIPNGPIQQFFQQYILRDFIESNFQNENELMACQFGMLTTESHVLFKKKLRHIAEEFLMLCEQDANEPIEKKRGTACILMHRPWAPLIFEKFIKK